MLNALCNLYESKAMKESKVMKSKKKTNGFYISLLGALLASNTSKKRFLTCRGYVDRITVDSHGHILEMWAESVGYIIQEPM